MAALFTSEKEDSLELRTKSERETISVGRGLGELAIEGMVVGLKGELGSGKTRFVQGMARGLGVPENECVTSPTFALVHEYSGGRLPIYHIDLYRIDQGKPDPELGLEEYLGSKGVCVLEWAERIEGFLPQDRMEVVLSIEGPRSRKVVLRALGPIHKAILERLKDRNIFERIC